MKTPRPPPEAAEIICDVAALTEPDLRAVDALARLQLTARRVRRRLLVRGACGELRDLLAFVGLADVVPCVAELPLEPRGQAEEREQALGVEEERDPAEPMA